MTAMAEEGGGAGEVVRGTLHREFKGERERERKKGSWFTVVSK